VYKGRFKNNKKYGKGTKKYANGDEYEGEWKDGRAHGNGKIMLADGEAHEGEWNDGKMHVKGTKKFAHQSIRRRLEGWQTAWKGHKEVCQRSCLRWRVER